MSSPKANNSSPARSRANSASPMASPGEEMDMSLLAWLTNTHTVLKWPGTILTVAGLLVAGAFAGIAPRNSLDFLDNTLGSSLFFILPFVFTILLDWPTGLLAAVVSLILFARLQKKDTSEGFSDTVDDTSEQNTKLVSNPHRWFIERMLGERPVAISSDRIITRAVQGNDDRESTPSSHTQAASIESSSSSNK
jgi:hypothetical protein